MSEQEDEGGLLLEGPSGCTSGEGPPGIVRGEGDEDLDLDLGGGSEKEGGEQKFQVASFSVEQTRCGGR